LLAVPEQLAARENQRRAERCTGLGQRQPEQRRSQDDRPFGKAVHVGEAGAQASGQGATTSRATTAGTALVQMPIS